MLSAARASISGPTKVPFAIGFPIGNRAYAAFRRLMTSAYRDECTYRRRNVVQRWPHVPTAPNTIPRIASSKSALGATIAALFPPSSSKTLPSLRPTTSATERPIGTEPVALTRATPRFAARDIPTSAPPCAIWCKSSGTQEYSAKTRFRMDCTAAAQSGAFSLGFQITGSPHTNASIAFHAHTATGKLNAEITPTTPSGCHSSLNRWFGRSLAIVSPVKLRLSPTA